MAVWPCKIGAHVVARLGELPGTDSWLRLGQNSQARRRARGLLGRAGARTNPTLRLLCAS